MNIFSFIMSYIGVFLIGVAAGAVGLYWSLKWASKKIRKLVPRGGPDAPVYTPEKVVAIRERNGKKTTVGSK